MDSGSLSSWFTACPVFSLLFINYHLQIAAARISWELFFFFFFEERGKPLDVKGQQMTLHKDCFSRPAGAHPWMLRAFFLQRRIRVCSTHMAQPGLVPAGAQPSLGASAEGCAVAVAACSGQGQNRGRKVRICCISPCFGSVCLHPEQWLGAPHPNALC